MKLHDYTWKIGIEITSARSLTTNKPLRENMVFADLYTGDRYVVQTVYEASPRDRAWSEMPSTVIQTWPIETLAEEQLRRLRETARYTPNEFSGPYYDIAFS